ncbi:MAG: hypothetical protein AAGA56_27455 [Myxococcota bacterium]
MYGERTVGAPAEDAAKWTGTGLRCSIAKRGDSQEAPGAAGVARVTFAELGDRGGTEVATFAPAGRRWPRPTQPTPSSDAAMTAAINGARRRWCRLPIGVMAGSVPA